MFLWWPRMDKPNTSAPLVANTGEHEWTGRRDERPSHNKSISILYLSCLHADLSQEWLVQEKCGHIFILWFQNSSQRIRLDPRHPETHLKAPFISRWNSFCSSMLVSYKHKLIRLHVVVEKEAKEKCSERHIRSVALIFSLASTRFFAWMHHYEMFIATM